MTRETETTTTDSGTTSGAAGSSTNTSGTTTTETASGSGDTMGEISHTNPYTDESTGQLFSRGPIVAADGGRSEAVEPDDDQSERTAPDEQTPDEQTPDEQTTTDERTMKTVSHTPPTEEADSNRTNRVFERGKVRADSVEDNK
ncbi:hypothetical protein [Halostagnicola sp. A-GB9-2]|uniref:hypothetical protein n=1 Tax=Halostagnicola sp. A-GB9-2 TaxID=3048066 RepID=UPI0024BFACFC|nr:hypothetical protein [Halostagnicola sp. A-GB9-2]MDJ1430460.1 hypothetical protein [Halostagnicola sp. A-GB9-2]